MDRNLQMCGSVMMKWKRKAFSTVFCSENVNIVWVLHRIFLFFLISSRGVIMQSLHPMSQEPVGWFNMKINPQQIVRLQWRLIESIINQIWFFFISLSHCGDVINGCYERAEHLYRITLAVYPVTLYCDLKSFLSVDQHKNNISNQNISFCIEYKVCTLWYFCLYIILWG